MSWKAFRRPRRTTAVAAIGVSALLSLTACGSSSTSGGSAGGLPSTIKVDGIIPLTGPLAFVGTSAQKGYELAIDQINSQHYLGSGTTMKISWDDTKSTAQPAASATSAAVADKSVTAAFGSVASDEAVAQSPIAQKGGLPIVYTQAGSDGVVLGDYTYRDTPLMSSYYPIIKKFIQQQGWKSIGVIYTNTLPTLQEVATKTYPALANELGINITKTVATTATTQDFSAPIQQVLSTHPDGVALLESGAAAATSMNQLRQAGYTGVVLGNSGSSGGSLTPAGQNGAGMVWPVDFDYQQKDPTSVQFVKAYQAKYNAIPLNYAAEAYDAAWFLAKSIKAAGSADRSAVAKGMATVAEKPMDGALGSQLTWKDGTLSVPGVVIEWTNTGPSKTKYLYAANGN